MQHALSLKSDALVITTFTIVRTTYRNPIIICMQQNNPKHQMLKRAGYSTTATFASLLSMNRRFHCPKAASIYPWLRIVAHTPTISVCYTPFPQEAHWRIVYPSDELGLIQHCSKPQNHRLGWLASWERKCPFCREKMGPTVCGHVCKS